jgi:Phage tail repeat like
MQLIVTAAGLAALIAAQNDGTNAVLVSEIGLTAAAFDPESASALPAEIKRITTFAGEAVSNDTIHVNIADDSSDTYTLRGFALYLDDGTAFALYGQPVATTIIEKAGAATMLLSCDVRFAQIDATEITFGDSTWTNPPATETVLGVSRRATVLQAVAGNSTDTTMTPKGDKAALDGRLGEASPSAFVKALLNLATAGLFRTAIGLKEVATLNMGSNNGIDADMLDGKHASEFAAAAHSHAVGSISGLQLALDGKAPSVHTHAISNVTGLQIALDAKAPSASPQLTGTPTAPTASPGTNTTQLATTEFVQAAIAAALANYLTKHNPTFTGTMTGPNYNKPV